MEREFKLERIDVEILNFLKGFPKGTRVKQMRKYLELKQSHVYKRLKILENLGLVVNKYPIWRVNFEKIKNIKVLTKNKIVYFDRVNNKLLTFKKEYCYFCGYNKVLDEHHIISKEKGGINKKANLLIMCPNCHTLLHRNRYKLKKVNNFWRMEDSEGSTIMLPFVKRGNAEKI